jgi:anaerobic ribonucleoside-triphosphate reductase activating protein
MRILNIIKQTMADGPGIRNSIYVAGCGHHCPGCHNPQSWDFNGGREMTIEEILDEVVEDGIDITITGGDPFYQETDLLALLERLYALRKNVWVYTGFTYEEIKDSPCMKFINTLVDGPYIEALRDTSGFKGSTNQRIINLQEITGEKL